MPSSTLLRAGGALLAVLATFGVGAPVTPRPSTAPFALPGPMDIVYADPANLMYSYGPTELERQTNAISNVKTATFNVTYSGFSTQAQQAFQAAVDIWASTVNSPIPIRVSAVWTPLGSGVLGSAGSPFVCTSTNGVPGTYYASALADRLNGSQSCSSSGFEIVANFNSNFANWEFGTSGAPVSGKYSFLSVVLHELGHGLGFFGSMTASGGIGSFGYTNAKAPAIYDRFAVTGGGAALIGFANPSSALGSQLVSDNTFFTGTNANASNNGNAPKLDTHFFTQSGASNGFSSGSSYSHIDDALYTGTPNGLMTWALAAAEVYTDPGPIARGMFKDMGWVVTPLSTPLLSIDGPTPNQHVQQPFITGGWAVDLGAKTGVGVDAIHVWAFPVVNGVDGTGYFVNQATLGGARSDVGGAFGSQFTNSGFNFLMNGLSPGTYIIGIYAHSSVTGAFDPNNAGQTRFVQIVIDGPMPNPQMSIDGPVAGQHVVQPFVTGGWAVDLGAPSGVGVDAIHVWAFPIVNNVVGAGQFVDQATIGGTRSDVGAVFGSRFANSGFNFLMNGLPRNKEYYIAIYVHSTVSGQFDPGDVYQGRQTKFVRVFID